MQKPIYVILLLLSFSIPTTISYAADDVVTSAADIEEIKTKLAELAKTQETIIASLTEIKAELEVVKIRATRK